MIQFFRKIRLSLIREGRIDKYIKYAFGEIVLVVAGILIALQINNWNQHRQDKEFEITMLREIKTSLESDKELNAGFVSFNVRTIDEGIQELLTMIASNQSYPDSVLLNAYNKMSIGTAFGYNSGGYETLKSIGLDKISNDSLRQELIFMYEVELPGIRGFLEYTVDKEPRNHDYKLQLHNKLWKRVQVVTPEGTYKVVSRPIDPENFLQQPELLDRIKIAQDNLNFYKHKIPHINSTIEKGLLLVNRELEHYEKN